MNEVTGGVLLAQLRKLDRILQALRANAQRVYEGIRDLPGLRLRLRPDEKRDMGSAVFLDLRTKSQRERSFTRAAAHRGEGDRPSGLAVIYFRTRPINQLWCSLLSPEYCHPRSLRRS